MSLNTLIIYLSFFEHIISKYSLFREKIGDGYELLDFLFKWIKQSFSEDIKEILFLEKGYFFKINLFPSWESRR